MISKSDIDKIFEASRVEEVIQDFVTLKKSGSNYKGLSPFVNEKTPSFVVSPAKQIWKDFSSGKGSYEDFSFIQRIIKELNIEIENQNLTDKFDIDLIVSKGAEKSFLSKAEENYKLITSKLD